ncbi:MAG: TonB-dependent receptor plug domain-containing protein [Candidatus Omnitrophota bacterium]
MNYLKEFFKVFLIGFFVVLTATSSYSSEIAANEELLWMDIPDITGVSKAVQSYKDVPMSVYVITNEEMDRWGVRSLYELFQRVPGYSFYNTDYYGQYGCIGRGLQSVWRYGCSFELMNVVDFGHMTFSPHFFDSIEIARGNAGIMWGSGAEAGLINFNIRSDLEGLETVVEAGNLDRQSVDILYGEKLDNGNAGDGFFIGWHMENQDYELQNDAFDTSGATWKENGLNNSQTLLGKIKYNQFKFIIFQDNPDHIAPKQWFGNAGLQASIEDFQDDLHDTLEVLAYRAEYHLLEEDIPLENTEMYFYHDYYKKQWWMESVALDTQRKRSIGVNAETIFGDDKMLLNYGGDLWGEDQNFAPSFTTNWSRPWGITWYDTNISPEKYTYRNFYADSKYTVNDQWKVFFGSRVDYQRPSDSDKTIVSGPRTGLIYTPQDQLTLKYIYNSGKRRPQANERAAGISEEQITAHEFIMMFELAEKLKLDTTIFYQKLTDQITRDNSPSALNAFVNTGGISTKGLEWALKYQPQKDLLVYWNGTVLRGKVSEGQSGLGEARNDKNEPLFVPKITSFLGAETSAFPLCTLNVDLRTIADIPYQAINGDYSSAGTYFVDFTARSKKLWQNKMVLSLVCLNVLDKQNKIPAFGEHAGNSAGTLEPEGRRWYLQATIDW